MKKSAYFLVFCTVLLAVSFLPFWDSIYKVFQPKGREGSFSQLTFTSVLGDYEIFLDGKLLGSVESKKSKDFTQIKPGMHEVKIVRKSDVPNFYFVLQRNIDFLASTAVEIAWESGPTIESSSGLLKYFTQVVSPENAQLYVLPFPQNASIDLDSKKSQNNLFDIKDTNTHNVTVSNGDGFELKTIPINLSDENTKKVLTDLRLVLEVYLYKQPFK